MSTILIAFALAFQQPTPLPQQPLRPEGPTPVDLNAAHDLYWEDADRWAPTRRTAIQRAGACVAGASADFASAVLGRDFTTRAYRNGMNQLVRNNQSCLRRRGGLRSEALYFAGAMAEHLISADSEPLNVRLMRAASRIAPPAYSQADQAAICLVRSVPDDVARLLATEVASEAEAAAARSLAPVFGMCSGNGQPVQTSAAGLRSIVAMAAFRQLNASATLAEVRN